MLVAEQAVERILSRQSKSIRGIARMLGVSRNTVPRYLRSEREHRAAVFANNSMPR
jgi:transposase